MTGVNTAGSKHHSQPCPAHLPHGKDIKIQQTVCQVLCHGWREHNSDQNHIPMQMMKNFLTERVTKPGVPIPTGI